VSKRLAKSYTRLVLEKRIVFDAAAVQTATEISDVFDSVETDALVAELSNENPNQQNEILFDILTAPASEPEIERSVLIIDSRVENIKGLLADLAPNTDVFVLDASHDGIQQIDTILADYNNLSSLQILSHANDASVVLGSSILDNTNIDRYGQSLSSWGDALSDTGDILLFGCDIANGEEGLAFVQTLADYTNADVAASTDYTGSSLQGGDWDLEVKTGSIETEFALSERALADFDGVLANEVPVDDNVSVDEDGQLLITEASLLANDEPGVSFVGIASQPTNGTLAVDAQTGDITYTPNANFNGADSFTYSVINLSQETLTATVNITVNSVTDTLIWINEIGDNDWNNADNWDLGFTPGNGDNVIIPDLQGSVVFSSGTVTLNSLTSSEDDFQVTGGRLLLGDDALDTSSFAVGSNVTLSGGEIGGLGVTNLNGDLNFSAGTLSGELNIANNSTLSFTNRFASSILTGTLNNTGTIEFAAEGSRLEAGTINNFSTGTIDFSRDLTVTVDAGNSSIINNGSIIKTSGAGESRFSVTTGSTLDFSGTGIFDSQVGNISVAGDATYAANFTASGNAGGTALRFNSGTHTFNNGSSLNDGDFIFRGGEIAGEVTIASDAALIFNDRFSSSDLTGTLNNAGTIEFATEGSSIKGGSINNTGTINLTRDLTVTVNGGNATIVNNGSINKTAGIGESRFNVEAGSALNFSGSGIFDSQLGFLSITGNAVYAANFSASGVAGGTALRLNGGRHDFGIGSTFSDGDFVFRGGEIAGDLTISNNAALIFNDRFINSILTGTLNNTGTVEFATEGSRLQGAAINNTGTIDFTNDLTVNVDVGNSTIINNGSITKSAGIGESRFNTLIGSTLNFSGSGVFDSQVGNLSIEGDTTYAENFSASGVDGGTALRINEGTHTFGAGSSFTNGDFIFRGGEIAGDLTIASNSALIFNDRFRDSNLIGTLNNAGTVEFATEGSRLQGATINNTGTIDFTNDLTVNVDVGDSTIINNGSITKSVGIGESRFNTLIGSTLNFSGSGVFDSLVGNLSIEGDTTYAENFSASGVAGGTALRINEGTHTFGVGSNFTNGDFIFRGGEIAGDLTIASNAALIFNDRFRDSNLIGTLNNAGTVEFATEGSRLQGATINNTGTIDFTNDLTVNVDVADSTIINDGSITKSAGIGDSRFNITAGSSLEFSGTGIFDSQVGNLSVEGNATYAADFTASGNDGGTALRINGGTHTFSAGSSINNGGFILRGGEIAGNLTIADDAILTFNDRFRPSDVIGTLNNEGVIEFVTEGSRLLGGTINNTGVGVVNFTNDLTLTITGGNSVINNNGSIFKTGGIGISRFNTANGSTLTFGGSGIFDSGLTTGFLAVDGDVNYNADFAASGGLNSTVFRIDSGTHTFSSGSSLNNGDYLFRGGEIAGDLTISSDAALISNNAFSFSDFSGAINNAGTLSVLASNTRFTGGSVSNSGTFNISSNINISDGAINNSGTLFLENDADLINNGGILNVINNGSIVKTSGAGDSQFRLTGAGTGFTFSGNGTVDAQAGFISIDGSTDYANNFTISGGQGPNALRITNGVHTFGAGSQFTNGNYIFRGGTIAGELTLAADASLVSDNAFTFSDFTGTFNNFGSIDITAGNTRFFDSTLNNTSSFKTSSDISTTDTTINNSGTIELAGDADFINSAGVLDIANNGSIIKTAGTGDSQFRLGGGDSFSFSGTGIVDAQTGFISILGDTNYADNFTVSGGQGPNALRINSGVHTFGAGSQFTNGNYIFRGGTIAGELTLAADASLVSENAFSFSDFTGTFNNLGNVQITAGSTRFVGSTFNNVSMLSTTSDIATFDTIINNTGTIELAGDADFINSAGVLDIANNGSIIKTAGIGDSQFRLGGGDSFSFSGTGIVDAQTGFISFLGDTNYADNFMVSGGQGPNALRINSGVHTFGAGSQFTNGNYIFRGGTIAGELTLAADASLVSENAFSFSDFTGTFNNLGNVQITSASTRIQGGTLNNQASGTIEFVNDSDLTANISATINNSGTILKSGGNGVSLITNGATFSNNGGVIDAQTGTLQLPSSVSSSGYILQGNGTINLSGTTGPIVDIRPGNSPGILNITGDIDLDFSTNLSIEVGGPNAGLTVTDHDQVNLSGVANFNGGSIEVSFLNGFEEQLVLGQAFTIATYTSSTGSAQSLTINASNIPVGLGLRLNDTGTTLQLVVSNNDAPTAADDEFIFDTATAINGVNLDVLSNDFDPNGDNISIIDFTQPSNGFVELVDGEFIYFSDSGFVGFDSFSYTISDPNGAESSAIVDIEVFGNSDPVANDDTFAANAETLTVFNVLDNDFDPDEDNLFILDVTQPSNGSASINDNGELEYISNAGFSGVDTFTYQISDGNGGIDTANVSVNVLANNDAPTASDDEFIFDAAMAINGVNLDVLSNDFDPNGDNISIIDFTQPSNGFVELVDGEFIYFSDSGFVGFDSFSYTISDPNGAESSAVVDIEVFGNSDPVANDDTFAANAETLTVFNVLDNDFDPDEDNLFILDVTQPSNGSVSINDNGELEYISNAGFSGVDTFTYQISDGNGGIDTANVSVNVFANEEVSVRGDNTSTTDPITGTVVSFTQGMNGAVIDNGDGTFTYQANQGFRGADSFTVTTTVNGVSVDRIVNVTVYQNVVSQTWTGQAGDGNWSNPDNWNLGLTPADGDSVSIPDGVDTIVFTSGNVTLQTLALSDTLIVSDGAITVMGNATILNNGVLDIAAGQIFAVNGGDFINNGTINGKGTLDVTQATSFVNNGTLSPGNSPGTLTIDGDFTQTPNGTIVLEIAGLTPGTLYDQLIVNGTAILNGTVNIVLLNGFVLPSTGNFQLISASSIIGSPTVNTPTGVTFDLFSGATTSSGTTSFNGTGTFTFGPSSTGTTGYISISSPRYTYEPIQIASNGTGVTPIVYRSVGDSEWTGVIDELSVALLGEQNENDALVAEFEALLENEAPAAGESLSEYELKLEQQIDLTVSEFNKEQLAVLDVLLQTPDTLSCR